MDQSEPKAVGMRFRIWMIAVSLLVASALGVAVVLCVQNHQDHVLAAQITQSEAELRAMGARIADVKDHEFKTMAEYVAAYAQIEPC
jgi:septal ring factor EnvC (AmiA/AmiB activator)